MPIAAHPALVATDGRDADASTLLTAERVALRLGIQLRAVIAADYGMASVRAAAIACRLLAPGGMLSLVHVRTARERREPLAHACGAHGLPHTNELRQRLVAALRHGTTGCEDCGATLRRDDVAIGTATLAGDPATELLAYAAQVGADLVAVGMHDGGSARRPNLGRVATDVIRRVSARLPGCSVLACVVPPAAVAARIARQLAGPPT